MTLYVDDSPNINYIFKHGGPMSENISCGIKNNVSVSAYTKREDAFGVSLDSDIVSQMPELSITQVATNPCPQHNCGRIDLTTTAYEYYMEVMLKV